MRPRRVRRVRRVRYPGFAHGEVQKLGGERVLLQQGVPVLEVDGVDLVFELLH